MTSEHSGNEVGREASELVMAASILHSASHPLRPGLLLGRLALAEIVVIGLLALAALTFCPASRGCEHPRGERVHAYHRTHRRAL